MNFIPSTIAATLLVFLFLQIDIISTSHSRLKSPIYRLNITENDLTNKSTRDENSNSLTNRRKRDIRSDILENELQLLVQTYNSEITSQAKTAMNTILSRSGDLDGLRNLLSFNFNNLATSGLNELSNVASKLPLTIQKCYNSFGFKFSDAIGVAKIMAGQCLVNKINEAKSIVQDFRNSITDAIANLRDVTGQITQCRILANLYPSIAGLIARASCLNIAILSIRGETVLLPLKFATLMGKAFNSVLTIQSDMNKCGLEIINTILDQSIQSGRAINNCINERNGTMSSTFITGLRNVTSTIV